MGKRIFEMTPEELSEAGRKGGKASVEARRNKKKIARTEGHRVSQEASLHAQHVAKSKSADVVKQWCSILDSRTRPSHRIVDGEIRDLDEKFSNGLLMPGDPEGIAKEVINCRCVLLQRAKWALDEDELQTLKDRAEYFELDKSDSFEDFRKKYIDNVTDDSYNSKKKTNKQVRDWYVEKVSSILDSIDKSLPIEEQAKQAFEARNRLRTRARNMMEDEETRKILDETKPNMTFEELIQSKMKRKGMSKDEAIRDILKTSVKTNESVNKEFGIEE